MIAFFSKSFISESIAPLCMCIYSYHWNLFRTVHLNGHESVALSHKGYFEKATSKLTFRDNQMQAQVIA